MVRASNRRIWKDRRGFGGLTAALAIILIIALVGIAYLATAQTSAISGGQEDKDKNGDGIPDPIIGYLKVDVNMEMDNGAWAGGFDYSILSVTGTFIDEPSTTSILGGMMSMFETDQDFKLTIKITFPAEEQTIMNKEIKFTYEIGGGAVEEVTKSATTGGIRYHGSYAIEVTLYDESGQVDQMVQTVVI